MSGPYLFIWTLINIFIWSDFSQTHLSIIIVRDLISFRSALFFLTHFAVNFHNFDKNSSEFNSLPSLEEECIRLVLRDLDMLDNQP